MNWNDTNATQTEPSVRENVQVSVQTKGKVDNIWLASPDFYNGSPIELPYKQEGDSLTLALPVLKYWDMLVIAYAQ
jgi:dextranase